MTDEKKIFYRFQNANQYPKFIFESLVTEAYFTLVPFLYFFWTLH